MYFNRFFRVTINYYTIFVINLVYLEVFCNKHNEFKNLNDSNTKKEDSKVFDLKKDNSSLADENYYDLDPSSFIHESVTSNVYHISQVTVPSGPTTEKSKKPKKKKPNNNYDPKNKKNNKKQNNKRFGLKRHFKYPKPKLNEDDFYPLNKGTDEDFLFEKPKKNKTIQKVKKLNNLIFKPPKHKQNEVIGSENVKRIHLKNDSIANDRPNPVINEQKLLSIHLNDDINISDQQQHFQSPKYRSRNKLGTFKKRTKDTFSRKIIQNDALNIANSTTETFSFTTEKNPSSEPLNQNEIKNSTNNDLHKKPSLPKMYDSEILTTTNNILTTPNEIGSSTDGIQVQSTVQNGEKEISEDKGIERSGENEGITEESKDGNESVPTERGESGEEPSTASQVSKEINSEQEESQETLKNERQILETTTTQSESKEEQVTIETPMTEARNGDDDTIDAQTSTENGIDKKEFEDNRTTIKIPEILEDKTDEEEQVDRLIEGEENSEDEVKNKEEESSQPQEQTLNSEHEEASENNGDEEPLENSGDEEPLENSEYEGQLENNEQTLVDAEDTGKVEHETETSIEGGDKLEKQEKENTEENDIEHGKETRKLNVMRRPGVELEPELDHEEDYEPETGIIQQSEIDDVEDEVAEEEEEEAEVEIINDNNDDEETEVEEREEEDQEYEQHGDDEYEEEEQKKEDDYNGDDEDDAHYEDDEYEADVQNEEDDYVEEGKNDENDEYYEDDEYEADEQKKENDYDGDDEIDEYYEDDEYEADEQKKEDDYDGDDEIDEYYEDDEYEDENETTEEENNGFHAEDGEYEENYEEVPDVKFIKQYGENEEDEQDENYGDDEYNEDGEYEEDDYYEDDEYYENEGTESEEYEESYGEGSGGKLIKQYGENEGDEQNEDDEYEEEKYIEDDEYYEDEYYESGDKQDEDDEYYEDDEYEEEEYIEDDEYYEDDEYEEEEYIEGDEYYEDEYYESGDKQDEDDEYYEDDEYEEEEYIEDDEYYEDKYYEDEYYESGDKQDEDDEYYEGGAHAGIEQTEDDEYYDNEDVLNEYEDDEYNEGDAYDEDEQIEDDEYYEDKDVLNEFSEYEDDEYNEDGEYEQPQIENGIKQYNGYEDEEEIVEDTDVGYYKQDEGEEPEEYEDDEYGEVLYVNGKKQYEDYLGEQVVADDTKEDDVGYYEEGYGPESDEYDNFETSIQVGDFILDLSLAKDANKNQNDDAKKSKPPKIKLLKPFKGNKNVVNPIAKSLITKKFSDLRRNIVLKQEEVVSDEEEKAKLFENERNNKNKEIESEYYGKLDQYNEKNAINGDSLQEEKKKTDFFKEILKGNLIKTTTTEEPIGDNNLYEYLYQNPINELYINQEHTEYEEPNEDLDSTESDKADFGILSRHEDLLGPLYGIPSKLIATKNDELYEKQKTVHDFLASLLGYKMETNIVGVSNRTLLQNFIKRVAPNFQFKDNEEMRDTEILDNLNLVPSNQEFLNESKLQVSFENAQNVQKPTVFCPEIFSYVFDDVFNGWSGIVNIPKFLTTTLYHIKINGSFEKGKNLDKIMTHLEVVVTSTPEEILGSDLIQLRIKFPRNLDVLPRIDGITVNDYQICNELKENDENRFKLFGEVKIKIIHDMSDMKNWYFVPNMEYLRTKIGILKETSE